MENNGPKISVVIITYKQENLIKRAIESLLSQREYIYEICVSDDCSPDHTWEVLLDYDKKYPNLFKLHRNEHNLGIFQNIEVSWEMPSGDMIYRLAGDDECGEGWFKNVVDFIKENNIDWRNELFSIFGNYKCIYPNGDSIILKNNKFVSKCANNSNNELLRYYLRGIISSRSCCFSKKILDNFQKISKGRSYIVEKAQDSQLYIYTKKVYYISYVGNLYYSKVGVSVHMSEQIKKEHSLTMDFAYQFFEYLGIPINSKDKLLPLKNQYYNQYYNKKTIKSLFLYLKYSFLSYDKDIKDVRSLLKLNLFRICRRIPHRRYINW